MTTEEWVKQNGGYEYTPGDEPSTRISRTFPVERDTLKEVVRERVVEALKDWERGVEYLHSPTSDEGRYYCSRPDCEGVRFKESIPGIDISDEGPGLLPENYGGTK